MRFALGGWRLFVVWCALSFSHGAELPFDGFVLGAGQGSSGTHSLHNILCRGFGFKSWHWRAICEKGTISHRGLPHQRGAQNFEEHQRNTADIIRALERNKVSALLDSPVPYIFDELREWLGTSKGHYYTILSERDALEWAANRLQNHGRTALICRESINMQNFSLSPLPLQRRSGANDNDDMMPALHHPFSLRTCFQRAALRTQLSQGRGAIMSFSEISSGIGKDLAISVIASAYSEYNQYVRRVSNHSKFFVYNPWEESACSIHLRLEKFMAREMSPQMKSTYFGEPVGKTIKKRHLKAFACDSRERNVPPAGERRELRHQMQLERSLVFVHWGKTGGGLVRHILEERGIFGQFENCHPRPCVALRDIKASANVTHVLVTVRDPIDRFVSAFDWRKMLLCRPGDPRRKSHGQAFSDPKRLCDLGREKERHILHSEFQFDADRLAIDICKRNKMNISATLKSIRHMTMLTDNLPSNVLLNPNIKIYATVLESGFDFDADAHETVLELLSELEELVPPPVHLPSSQVAGARTSPPSDESYLHRIFDKKIASSSETKGNTSNTSASTISEEGKLCLLNHYHKDYELIGALREAGCHGNVALKCRSAIDSILRRRGGLGIFSRRQ